MGETLRQISGSSTSSTANAANLKAVERDFGSIGSSETHMFDLITVRMISNSSTRVGSNFSLIPEVLTII